MDNSKLNNFEAIAVVLTITLTHSVLTLPKAIITITRFFCIIKYCFCKYSCLYFVHCYL